MKKCKKEVEVKKGGVHYNGGKLRNVRERERELCSYKGNYLALSDSLVYCL